MKIKNGMVVRRVVDTDIVVDVTGGFSGVMKLNETSLEIWNAVAAGKSLPEIAAALTAQYEVSEAQALEDAERFCSEMVAQGFFEA